MDDAGEVGAIPETGNWKKNTGNRCGNVLTNSKNKQIV